MPFQDKNIVLAISGGIAAYKSVELVSLFRKLGANVYCVLSESAENFVAPLSLEVMSKNKVYTKQDKHSIEANRAYIDHIELAQIADLILIAPATANTISKLACGISDDLIFDIILASQTPVAIAPAMNTNMWAHKVIQRNLSFLMNELNYHVIPPDTGKLACGVQGIGRLAELGDILKHSAYVLENKTITIEEQEGLLYENDLKDKNIIISSGGTREYIDPVRFIGNESSGEMGFALAHEALARGANVTLITTVDYEKDSAKLNIIEHPRLISLKVSSCEDMQKALANNFNESSDIVIMAAAVADYRPIKFSEQKIKKGEASLNIELGKNPDLIKELAVTKLDHQIMVGFCLETEKLLENAETKLIDKNLDMIIANSKEALGNSQSQISIIYSGLDTQNLEIKELEFQDKSENAKAIFDQLNLILKTKNAKNSNIISG